MKIQDILCWLGFHDWETVKQMTENQIRDVLNDVNNPFGIYTPGDHQYKNKICIHCGATYYGIEEKKIQIEEEIKEMILRQSKAITMWEGKHGKM